jgi:hypothetical protein
MFHYRPHLPPSANPTAAQGPDQERYLTVAWSILADGKQTSVPPTGAGSVISTLERSIMLTGQAVAFRHWKEVSFRPEQDGFLVLRSGETPAFQDAGRYGLGRVIKRVLEYPFLF